MSEKTQMSRPDRLRRCGLTLVELLITVTIGTILMALAIPQYQTMIARKRVVAAANELVSDARFTRAELTELSESMFMSFNSNSDYTCYIIYPEGNGTGYCNCARTSVPFCDTRLAQGRPHEIKTVIIKRSSGVTLTTNRTHLYFRELIGAPNVDFRGSQTVIVNIQHPLGGHLRVSLHEPVKPTICSVSGHTAEFGACP